MMTSLSYSIKSIENLLNYIPEANLGKQNPFFNSTMQACIKRALAALQKLPQETIRDTELFTQDVSEACIKFTDIKILFETHARTSLFNHDTKKEGKLLIYNLNRLNSFYESAFSLFSLNAPHYIAWKYEPKVSEARMIDTSAIKEPEPEDTPQDPDEEIATPSPSPPSLNTPLLEKSQDPYVSYATYMRKNIAH